jgi:hypothetical protein
MNHVFNKQLRKHLLVFFHDLLIYNKTWEEHLRHVDQILSIMEEQSLYAKCSVPNLSVYHVLHGIYRIHTGFYKQMHLTQLNTLKTQSKIHGYCYN